MIAQTRVVHLLRNFLRCAARQDWGKIAKILKPVCTAATEDAALERFAGSADAWGGSIQRWSGSGRTPGWGCPRTESGGEFTPLLRFDTEIRRSGCTSHAIESVTARIRRTVKARGRFTNGQAVLKCVYMAIMSLPNR